jgi:DNA-binding NtrC family response regulator
MRSLIIDDEHGIRLSLGHFLQSRGYEVMGAESGSEGLTVARTFLPDLVFLDERLPDTEGEVLLPYLIAPEIGSCVMMMTGHVELDQAVRAMKKGAEYFFAKPIDFEQVAIILDRLEEQFKRKRDAGHYRELDDQLRDGQPIIGDSPPIIGVQRLIDLLAKNSSTPVLILGESGSGKELVARAIHRRSGVTGPLIEINCASLSETLLESELFGHEKGAFTDAKRQKSGLFEIAAAGTIFFDELAEMPIAIQAKLLKVLDTRTFRRVGGTADIRSNARFIGATNRDIARMVKSGLFREDLYYRINVMPITVPPLRERGDDIVKLADYFARVLGENMGKRHARIMPATLEYLRTFDWPGNVRELRNVVERALILAGEREVLPEHLPLEIRSPFGIPAAFLPTEEFLPLLQVEEEHIARVLRATGNNHSRTASILGISRSTLLARLKKMVNGVRNQDMP